MNKIFRKFIIACLVASFFAFPLAGIQNGAQAQDSFPPTLEPRLSADGQTLYDGVPILVILDDPNPDMQGLKTPGRKAQDVIAAPEAATATFSISYIANGETDHWGQACETFPADAQAALEAAAAIWGNTVQSAVPITVQACWANLGDPEKLGYSGGQPVHIDFSGAPKAETWYEAALANSIAGSDLEPSSFDDFITFNSQKSWYYGTDGNPPWDQHDLVSVALHEIGHGLNISGSASYADGSGNLGYNGHPYIYDTFMEDESGTAATSFTSPSTELGTLLTSGALWFDGPKANAANGGTRVKMYAPSTWQSGSSYSHLDYDSFAGTINSLMVYAIGAGSANHNPGPVTVGLMKDMGWTMAPGLWVPQPDLPVRTITDRSPTYRWSVVEGASKYQYQLVNGTKTVYTKTVSTIFCNATSCSHTPWTNLAYDTQYKWRVRALLGQEWQAYSSYKSFKIIRASFTTNFNTSHPGWTPLKGSWSHQSSMYYASAGLANKWSSIKYKDPYKNGTFEVNLKRNGNPYYSSGIIVRGTPTPFDSANRWNKEYKFVYTNAGSFSIWKVNGASVTALQPWTSSTAIHRSGSTTGQWNVLKVVFSGTTLKFYINGKLVATVTDSSFETGNLGVVFFRDNSAGNQLLIDWAKLTNGTVLGLSEEIPLEGILLPGGTDAESPVP